MLVSPVVSEEVKRRPALDDACVPDITGTYEQVVFSRVVFAGVVCSVVYAFFPQISEEGLRPLAFEPLEAHVHAFGCSQSHHFLSYLCHCLSSRDVAYVVC